MIDTPCDPAANAGPTPPRPQAHWAFVVLLVLATGIAGTTQASNDSAEPWVAASYLTTRDGTRLAVDVALPSAHGEGDRWPALVELTRYWRASEDPATGEPRSSLGPLENAALAAGYAVVQVDVRGSGASFGHRLVEYGPEEVRDGWDVLEWIANQPWSNGKVGAHGVSYSGTTAELLAATGHPALKAVVPGWSDFDVYRSPARPYGLYAADFIETWGHFVGLLDTNDPQMGAVKRVDVDADGSLRAAAVAEHRANPAVAEVVSAADFRDQPMAGSDYSWADLSVLRWEREIEQSGVPMLVFASWLDAGTAEGALWRLANLTNPQHVVILASIHGGGAHASPYTVSDRLVSPIPSSEEQIAMRLEFFDHFVKGSNEGRQSAVEAWPRVRYFNLGAEEFLESEVWPPEGMTSKRFYLDRRRSLSTERPAKSGKNRYRVDFEVSTGSHNRWTTQMGEPVLGLDDRGAMDARMLNYTTPPLEEDLQVTGFPQVRLWLRSSTTDGALLVYLEDVAPDGRSRYLTEGGLRLIHRKVDTDPGFEAFGPVHSFAKADARPMVPGERTELALRLHPISVRLAKGHRLRLAISGADAGIFERLPEDETPILTLERGGEHASWLELPVLAPASSPE